MRKYSDIILEQNDSSVKIDDILNYIDYAIDSDLQEIKNKISYDETYQTTSDDNLASDIDITEYTKLDLKEILNYIDNLTDDELEKIKDKISHIENDNVWKLNIDISKMWKQYEAGSVNVEQFNSAYIHFLQANQKIIQENSNSWEKLNDILTKLEEKKSDEEGCISIWDDIYDWGDENFIEINAQNKTDF
jgi:hypothetical protein